MTAIDCRRVSDAIEAVAAGDLVPDETLRAHLESCPRCAAALAAARRIEMLLSSAEPPRAPARFTPQVMTRIHRDRWRAEEHVDRIFNVAIAAALLLVAGGVAAILNVGAVMNATAVGWSALTAASAEAARQIAPFLATYLAAAGLLASALGMWWWAERRLMT
jgi:anti-sigma factor RsiW